MSIPEDGIPGWERAELARAIHSCESRALIAFYMHFRPLLTERAVAFGVPVSERADAVESFLGDMLLSLAAGEQLPMKLHGYVLISFRRYAARRGKAQSIEDNGLAEFQNEFTASHGKRVAEGILSYEVGGRAEPGRPFSGSHFQTNSALKTFCELLLAELDVDDRLLLAAKAEEMPLREIASLLGVNYNAANTRLFRVRANLRAKAADVVSRMEYSEREVVERFLRRARVGVPRSSTNVGEEGEQSRRLGNG